MKKVKLLFWGFIVVFGLLSTSLSAQTTYRRYSPEVYTMWHTSPDGKVTAIREVIDFYEATHVPGFQQSHMPQFIITAKDNRFTLGIGGFVNFRTAFDFEGNVGDIDFITYDIPVPGNYATRQQFRMDASTSRLFFKATAKTKALGNVVAYMETDFRGASSNLRIREAFISFKGFLFGQNVTTFCDLTAAPTTIDFQGPNAYTFNFNTMIRYTRDLSPSWSIGAALEMPQISAIETPSLKTIPQRLPDLPVYVQYNWGKNKGSHLRASGVFRDLYYHSMTKDDNKSAFGWGAQLSAKIKMSKRLTFFGQGVYGRGITPYIQELNNSGLDIVPDPENMNELQTIPMFGWFGSLQYNISQKVFCSGGYSQVSVLKENGYGTADQYRLGQYVFANAFWNVTPFCQVGIEYLYGVRKNMDSHKNHANRIQAAIQYNF